MMRAVYWFSRAIGPYWEPNIKDFRVLVKRKPPEK
jgi:hypothetical protein